MSKLSYKISYYALYVMFAVIAVVIGLFYFGGDAQGNDVITGVDPEMWQPANTNALMFLTYALLGIAVAATALAAIFQFGSALKDNPVNAIKSLIGVILLGALLFITWSLGSEEKLAIQGYDGTDNVPFWLKISDMFLYTVYSLLSITIIAIVVSFLKKSFS